MPSTTMNELHPPENQAPMSNRRITGKICTFAQYHDSYFSEEMNRFSSVDMVRLKLKFSKSQAEYLREYADTFTQCDDFRGYTVRGRAIGKYHELRTYALGDSSVTFGLGLFDSKLKLQETKGFIEFNPNKVADDSRFEPLLSRIIDDHTRSELARYDFALDIPEARNNFRLSMDGRNYASYVNRGNILTEYLGTRNKAGYVKLYDKANELGIDADLTRAELTCEGSWTVDDVMQHFPTIRAYNNPIGLKGVTQLAAVLLQDAQRRGEAIEPILALLDCSNHTKAKIRKTLSDEYPTVTRAEVEHVISSAKKWETVTSK